MTQNKNATLTPEDCRVSWGATAPQLAHIAAVLASMLEGDHDAWREANFLCQPCGMTLTRWRQHPGSYVGPRNVARLRIAARRAMDAPCDVDESDISLLSDSDCFRVRRYETLASRYDCLVRDVLDIESEVFAEAQIQKAADAKQDVEPHSDLVQAAYDAVAMGRVASGDEGRSVWFWSDAPLMACRDWAVLSKRHGVDATLVEGIYNDVRRRTPLNDAELETFRRAIREAENGERGPVGAVKLSRLTLSQLVAARQWHGIPERFPCDGLVSAAWCEDFVARVRRLEGLTSHV